PDVGTPVAPLAGLDDASALSVVKVELKLLPGMLPSREWTPASPPTTTIRYFVLGSSSARIGEPIKAPDDGWIVTMVSLASRVTEMGTAWPVLVISSLMVELLS